MRRLMSSAAVAVILFAAGGVSAAASGHLQVKPKPAAIAAQAGSKGATFATVTTQLPRAVRPTHYDLSFTPDADKMAFTAFTAGASSPAARASRRENKARYSAGRLYTVRHSDHTRASCGEYAAP